MDISGSLLSLRADKGHLRLHIIKWAVAQKIMEKDQDMEPSTRREERLSGHDPLGPARRDAVEARGGRGCLREYMAGLWLDGGRALKGGEIVDEG